MEVASQSPFRLAELVASLSLATDLGLGQPQEHVLRQTLIATRLARISGLNDGEQASAFYVSLLAMVGCVADSHELARWFDDDTHIRAASYQVDRAGLPMLRFLIGNVAGADSSVQRVALVGRFLASGMREVMASMAAHCEVTADIADRLGLAEAVGRALPQALERWDGKGGPRGLSRDQIEPVMRVAQIANDAEVFWRLGGSEATVAMLRERRGSAFDPDLVDAFASNADEILGDLATVDAWSAVIDGCAPLDRALDEVEVRTTLEAFADYADVKSPWFSGHSRAVAALAGEAARLAGLPQAGVDLVSRASLVCRVGTIGVSSGIWNKAGPLSAMERERIRTVPYLTERVLAHEPRLAEIGAIAGMFHERLDGSGYPRGIGAATIGVSARIVAVAEMYQAMREARPHRTALPREEAERELRREAHAGRVDPEAVSAVLSAAGHRTSRRPNLSAGLSARELEVLGLLVRGYSNKQIAAALFISRRTAGSHIEHLYTKLDVTTRGAAAMYAMRHGLIDPTPSDEGVAHVIG